MRLFVKDRKFYASLASLTAVIALQNLITFGVNLADNVMIGGYSQAALNGVALVNQIQFLLQMFAGGVANGIVVIAAQYWGKRDIEPIRKIFAVGFWLGIAFSVLLTLVAFFFPSQTLSLLTNEASAIAEGAKYLRIICFSYCIFSVTTILLGTLRSVETVRIGFYVSLLSLVVNISLNYCLIYGHFGLPELGVEGAAIATLISRIVEFAVILVYVGLVDRKLRLRLRHLLGLSASYARDFLRSGMPLVLSSTSWGIAMSIQTAIIGRLGEAAISASSIATTIFQVITVVSYGIATASGVVIGKTVGEGRIDDVKAYAKTLQVIFLIVGVLTSAALLGAKQFIVDLYKVTAESAALAHDFILVLCVTVIGTSYQMPVLTGIVSGGGETKFVLFNDIIFMWCIVLPVSAVSAFVLKLPSVVTFACLKSDQILKCAVAVVKVNRYRWIRVLTRSEE
ncbi:MAG: MATE family efflux transporter [Ruminococcaceae bacterium]|nr:MATE family efflux transporter [Oscillospiraceae bacterium]